MNGEVDVATVAVAPLERRRTVLDRLQRLHFVGREAERARSAGAVPAIGGAESRLHLNLDPGEIAALATAFREANSQFESARAFLERRVDERTREIDEMRGWFELMADAVSDGLLVVDEAGRVCSANRAALGILGQGGTPVVGRQALELFGPGISLDASEDELQEATLPNAEHRAVEVSVRRAELRGETEYVLTVRDISERRKTRRILRDQACLLEKAHVLMAAVLPNGSVQWCNPAFEEATGLSHADVLGGRSLPFAEDAMPRATIDAVRANFFAREEVHAELAFQHRTGRLTWIHVDGYPVIAPDGSLERYLVIGAEITEKKRQERLQADFISTVSHELRTPMTVVSGAFDALEMGFGEGLSEVGRELLEMGRRNCAQLGVLIDDLLDVNRLEAGAMKFRAEFVAVDTPVGDAVDALRGRAQEAGQQLRFLPVGGACMVHVDPQRLRQVVTNLLSNAIKYAGAKAHIEVGVRATGGRVRIEVRDDGPGIPVDFQARLFGKFARDVAVLESGVAGFGLGLYISRELVEQMGGSITCESAPGAGASFIVDLPECERPAAESAQGA